MTSTFHTLMQNGAKERIHELLEQGFKPSSALTQENLDLLYNALAIPVSASHQEKATKADIIKLLLQYDPAILDRTDQYGDSLVHLLARFGYNKVLQFLIDEDRSDALMIANKLGYAPIHFAIMNEKTETVRLLLTIPGMSDIKDWEQRNIIHYAARHSTEDMVRCCCVSNSTTSNINLLANAKDSSGNTPAQLLLDYNTTGDVEAIMDILVSHGAERLSRIPSPFR